MFLHKAPGNIPARFAGGMEALQSKTIDWLRFPLAVMVVFIHSFGLPSEFCIEDIHAHPLDPMNMYHLVRILFSHALPHIAVPTFFLISGLLFFRNFQEWNEQLYRTKMRSRLRTLVVPYLLWNVLAIACKVALMVGAFVVKGGPSPDIVAFFQENGWLRLFWDCHVWGEDRLTWLGNPVPNTGPRLLPLWFLRDLIVVSVLAPLIFWFIKRTRVWGLALLGLCYVSHIWLPIHGFSITAVFFFTAGAYLGINGKNLVGTCRRVRNLSYVLSLALLLPLVWFDGPNTNIGYIIYPFYVVCGVCAMVNIASTLVEKGRVHTRPLLIQSTFFIYALHSLYVLGICSKVIHKIIPWQEPLALYIVYFITPLLAVAVCVALFVLFQRCFPRISKVLNGNR